MRNDPSVSSTGKKCSPGSFLAEPVEQAVWDAVPEALRQPDLRVAEYQRRLEQSPSSNALEYERKQPALALRRVRVQEVRVTDAYINGAMDLERTRLRWQSSVCGA